MGSIRRKTVTKPLPAGAEIIVRKGERLAQWIDRRGKRHVAPLMEGRSDRIIIQAKTFTAKYRDGSGRLQEVATGCKDETAAKRVLADLEKRADNVRSGIATAAEDSTIDHRVSPIGEHIDAYIRHQQTKGVNAHSIKVARARLERLAKDCRFNSLSDLKAEAFEAWLVARQAEGMSAGNRNEFRKNLLGFCNWCAKPKVGRLLSNPFSDVATADTKSDQRRKRRSMTEAELVRLLDVARQRPMVDALMIRRGARKGQLAGNVRPEVRHD